MALPPRLPDDKKAERDGASQDVFLREVDEALRKDEMLGVAKRYGRPAGAAVAVVLLGLAAWMGWDWYQTKQAGERAERFTLALDRLGSGQASGAASDLQGLANDGSDASKAAATLTRAAILLGTGKQAEAVKGFDAVAADTSAPQPYRDLATLRSVATQFETMAPQQAIARLKPLAVPGKPFAGSAGELVGIAYLKAGQPQLAAATFAAVARDKTVPESLRGRSGQLAAQLGVDAVDQFVEAKGGAAAGPAAPTAPQ